MNRVNAGALQLNRRELYPAIEEDGSISLDTNQDDTPARKLVSEMMILANETAAHFALGKHLPLVCRGQEAPDVDIDEESAHLPDGPAREYYRRSFLKRSVLSYSPVPHYGLGVKGYAQVTSPIRRAVDLVNQRQITHWLQHDEVLYSQQELETQTTLYENGLQEAHYIQRNRNRYLLIKYLVQEKIRELEATIIKLDNPRPLVEVDIIRSFFPFHRAQGVQHKIGDVIRLKIESIDPRNEVLLLKEIR